MNKKRRICFVVHNYSDYGGVGFVAANLANEFVKKDKVTLVSLISDGRQPAYDLDPRVRRYNLIPDGFRLRQQQRMLFFQFRKVLHDNKIDIAVIMGQYPGYLVSLVKPFTKTRFIFCDHGALMNQWDDRKNTFMRWMSCKLCQKTIALTKKTKDDYIRKFHMREDKIDYIYNWIDLIPDKNHHYDASSKRIISVGRLGIEKGFDMLVKAFARIPEKHPDWHLDIYGDGEMWDEVEKLIHENHLDNHVHMKGMDPDVRQKYKDYSFYVMPSYREGLPIVLLEAKVFKLPIISFDILTGPREIVRPNKDGLLIRPYNLDKMYKAMLYLIEHEDVRCRMAEAAQSNLSEFSKESIYNKWDALFDSLM